MITYFEYVSLRPLCPPCPLRFLFGVEQRGGVSISYLQIGDQPIAAPKFEKGDIVVALSKRAVQAAGKFVDGKTTYIYDSSLEGVEEELPKNAGRILAIPAIEVSKQELHPRVFNIIIMGVVIKVTGAVSEEKIREAIETKLGYKFAQNSDLRELNSRAISRGMELIENIN